MKGVYIVLSHKQVVMKDPEHRGQSRMVENCEFVDRVRDKHLSEASVIIDLLGEKLIKCRIMDSKDPESFHKMIAHVEESYPDQYRRLLEIVSGKPYEELEKPPAEPEAVEAEAVEAECAECGEVDKCSTTECEAPAESS